MSNRITTVRNRISSLISNEFKVSAYGNSAFREDLEDELKVFKKEILDDFKAELRAFLGVEKGGEP